MADKTSAPLKIAAFASGRGSNIASILKHIEAGDINAKVVTIICNKSKAGAMELARQHNIPSHHISHTHFEDFKAFSDHMLSVLEKYETDLVVLAGYMRKMPTEVVRAYKGRMLNIHPALLPSFGGQGLYGKNVHQAVLDYGAKVSGATVHIVDEEYDTGPPVCQKCVPVKCDDTVETLHQRVLKIEHEIYPQAIKYFADRCISVEGRKVVIKED